MTNTACDDQFAPDPSDLMQLNSAQQLDECPNGGSTPQSARTRHTIGELWHQCRESREEHDANAARANELHDVTHILPCINRCDVCREEPDYDKHAFKSVISTARPARHQGAGRGNQRIHPGDLDGDAEASPIHKSPAIDHGKGISRSAAEGQGEVMKSQQAKGGHVARQAAMLCQDSAFQRHLDRRRRHKFGLTDQQLPDGTHNEQDAHNWLCAACQVTSSAELDYNQQAKQTFRVIRNRFNHWRARNKEAS